jgi:hypothetical protein
MLLSLNLRPGLEDILPPSVTQGLNSTPDLNTTDLNTADLKREAPHGVRVYLPPTLFAYLVEQAEHEGESLSSMIVDLLYKEFDSQNL